MRSIRSLRQSMADRSMRGRDIEALYKVLYDQVHDLDQATEISKGSTAAAFGRQWAELPEGEYLLSDPWFRDNVDRILTEQELLLKPEWFRGKRVLDAGCGSGRWSYGFSRLGADVTSVDINQSALDATRDALSRFDNPQRFVLAPLEDLDSVLAEETFDLVFCWGVAHHCVRFNKVIDNLTAAVAPGGVLYLYLYGRDSVPLHDDLRLFKERVAYNVLMTDDERMTFLLKKAHGDRTILHNVHDIYAPLINRRFELSEVVEMLRGRGFTDVLQTIEHTEVFVRATRGGVDLRPFALSQHRPPYWFQGKHI